MTTAMMNNSPSGEPDDEVPECELCGCELDWVDCYECGGDGEFDCHDDDPINYAPDEEYEICILCRGHGGWLECPNAGSHRKEASGK